jgi:hypothetical protein
LFPEQKMLPESSEFWLIFRITTNKKLVVGSNNPYEVWIDGKFKTEIMTRCNMGTFYKLCVCKPSEKKHTYTFRVHIMIHNQTNVTYRCLFEDNFWYSQTHGAVDDWECFLDLSISQLTKVNSMLPCQNHIKIPNYTKVPLVTKNNLCETWTGINMQTRPLCFNPLPLIPTLEVVNSSGVLSADYLQNPFSDIVHNNKHDFTHKLVFDMGCVGMAKVFVTNNTDTNNTDTNNTEKIVCIYTQTKDLKKTAEFTNWRKVASADVFDPDVEDATFYGIRGCRYIHVFFKSIQIPTVTILKCEYNLDFKPLPVLTQDQHTLVTACKNTLLACLDCGIVDTCWRERTQWVGDARIVFFALRKLTTNTEIPQLVLNQVAKTYNKEYGMVSGMAPAKCSTYELLMPTYHLLYCLTVFDIYTDIFECDESVRIVLQNTIKVWKALYLKNGLLRNVPGWHFVDWDDETKLPSGKEDGSFVSAHSILNIWWIQLCNKMNVDSGIDYTTFMNTFYIPNKGFKLTENNTDVCFHANVIIATSDFCDDVKEILQKIICNELQVIKNKLRTKASKKITPYFGFYVLMALDKLQLQTEKQNFIRDFYLFMAQETNSLWERYCGECSLAHSWSVGFIEYMW